MLDGIKHGFRLIDEGNDILPTECHNYSSLSDGDNDIKVAKQIQWEIDNGNYIATDVKPTIVSALGTIPKPNGKIRLIHDCSRPDNLAVNHYASLDPCKYDSLQDALELMKHGYYMAKVDLESAYRSVRIHPDNYQALNSNSQVTNSLPLCMTPSFLLGQGNHREYLIVLLKLLNV